MSYVRLVKLPILGKDFIEPIHVDIAKEMGYDSPLEIIQEVQPQPGDEFYLVHEASSVSRRPQGTFKTVTMLGLCGGRWYPCELNATQDAQGVLWITSEEATEF